MLLRQIGFTFALCLFFSSVFANQCPPVERVANCSGGDCYFQRVAGWSEIVYYTDKGKSLAFQKQRVSGGEINCFYSYLDPDTHRLMPPAIVLTGSIN